MNTLETTPVIVAVGEAIDRPQSTEVASEPVQLMMDALRHADADGGGGLLNRIESIDLVGLVTWRYHDPVALLCERLEIAPARRVNSSMGGESPVRLLHEAAVRIAKGEIGAAAIVGGESMNSMNRARKEGAKLPWTPLASKEDAVRFTADRIEISPISKLLGVTDPAQMYPLYEMAAQAAWGQSPQEGSAASAALGEKFATIAATNPYAWIRNAPRALDIATPGKDNRLIAWPYPKLMVANPSVNQAAAVIVMSLARAREAGVPADRIVYLWGGGAAAEPDDYLKRDAYDHSTAQAATLAKAVEIAGGDRARFDHIELYSCFPVVPKMALYALGLDSGTCVPTVTGGLTFFGGPLNNYMSHAIAAMVRRLRAAPSTLGLLYGQGGFVTKHHTMVLSTTPPAAPLPLDYSVQAAADAARGPIPPLLEHYTGEAHIETYTVLYGRDGEPLHGIVILRTPTGARTMARVVRDDALSLAVLTSTEKSAVGVAGYVLIDSFGKPVWESGARRTERPPYRFAQVEREGRITLITINRPASLNSLHPATNAELAAIFDEFAADPEQWVAIITGAGDRAFSSGNDLRYTATAMARGETHEVPLTGYGGITSRFDLTKPVIAAVNGVAMGGGFEVALACDIIIAADSAIFALPEPKVGLAALAGGLLRLPRQIGLKRAMDMILTGRRVSAAEGRELGFVNEITPADQLLATAKRWALQVAECSPMSIRASKQMVYLGLDEASLEAAYKNQVHYPATKALFRSAEIVEGPLAFSQKRPPQWKGK
jgi:acetyl-CoA C-acetyltransferase